MSLLVSFGAYGGVLFIAALFLIVGYKILTSDISLSALTYGERRDGTIFHSPGRVQMLIVSLAAATFYLFSAVRGLSSGKLPSVPTPLVAALASSHAVYLAGKAWAFFGPRK